MRKSKVYSGHHLLADASPQGLRREFVNEQPPTGLKFRVFDVVDDDADRLFRGVRRRSNVVRSKPILFIWHCDRLFVDRN